MTVDSYLFTKYNVGGPRYSSYPTVPHWTDVPSESDWIQSIADSIAQNQAQKTGISIYIHIPFCESLCTYCGCNTRITRNHDVSLPYIQTVLKEWDLYLSKLRNILQIENPVSIGEIHLGGGTPTFLSSLELKTLIEGITQKAGSSKEIEFSIELDPRVTTQNQLQTLFDLGFRRLSLGVQDFDLEVQKIVNRIQSEEIVSDFTQMARTIGFNSLHFDLIFGLPRQNLNSIRQTMGAIQTLRPDRIAFFSYTHVPWIKANQRNFSETDLPTPEYKRELYMLGRTLLKDLGYQEIGMDHFVLKHDPLWLAIERGTLHRNFVGYSARRAAPLIALGVSGIGDSGTVFSQNEKILENYQLRIEKRELPILRGHFLSQEDVILKKHILNLLTRYYTDWNDPSLFTSFLHSLPERTQELVKDDLIELTPHSCKITENGKPFLKNVCMAFDARLATKSRESQKITHLTQVPIPSSPPPA